MTIGPKCTAPPLARAGQVAGPRWALLIGGLAALACGILALPALTRIDHRKAPGTGRERAGASYRRAISSVSPAGYSGGLIASAVRQSTRRPGLSRMGCCSIP
jgi:hypothetical protein